MDVATTLAFSAFLQLFWPVFYLLLFWLAFNQVTEGVCKIIRCYFTVKYTYLAELQQMTDQVDQPDGEQQQPRLYPVK